jgi:hypothetical protein
VAVSPPSGQGVVPRVGDSVVRTSLIKGDAMKRLQVTFAVCAALAAVVPAAAAADPPASPPGCQVVLTTPAVTTGSAQGLGEKVQAYTRVCFS